MTLTEMREKLSDKVEIQLQKLHYGEAGMYDRQVAASVEHLTRALFNVTKLEKMEEE